MNSSKQSLTYPYLSPIAGCPVCGGGAKAEEGLHGGEAGAGLQVGLQLRGELLLPDLLCQEHSAQRLCCKISQLECGTREVDTYKHSSRRGGGLGPRPPARAPSP